MRSVEIPRLRYEGRVIVEIGFGLDPAFLTAGYSPPRKAYFTGVHYIGVEPDGFAVASAKTSTKYNETEHLRSIGLNTGTLKDLDLEPQSVDEVYMANVFAGTNGEQNFFCATPETMQLMVDIEEEPDIAGKKQLLRLLYPYTDDDPSMPFSAILSHMHLVRDLLKPEGKLTLFENNTPLDLEIILLLLDDLGFEINEIITQEDIERWREMEDRYHIQDGEIIDQEPYIIRARVRQS